MKNIVKSVLFIAAMMLFSVGVQAQQIVEFDGPQRQTLGDILGGASTVPDTHYTLFEGDDANSTLDNRVDYVTAGSRMPYQLMEPTGFNASWSFQYKWGFFQANGTTPYDLALMALTGATTTAPTVLTPISGQPNYYSQNEIAIDIPNVTFAGGASYVTMFIGNNIRTLDGNDNELCAPGADVMSEVRIVPPPSIEWNFSAAVPDEITLCNQASIPFPVTVSGYGEYEIEVTISYVGGAGNKQSIGYVVFGAVTDDGDDFNLLLDESLFAEFAENSVGRPFEYGIYEISITNITDRISRKSLVAVEGIVPLATSVYTVEIMAAPVPVLRHIRNN